MKLPIIDDNFFKSTLLAGIQNGDNDYLIAYRNALWENLEAVVPVSFVLVLEKKERSFFVESGSFVAEFGWETEILWKISDIRRTSEGYKLTGVSTGLSNPDTVQFDLVLSNGGQFSTETYSRSLKTLLDTF